MYYGRVMMCKCPRLSLAVCTSVKEAVKNKSKQCNGLKCIRSKVHVGLNLVKCNSGPLKFGALQEKKISWALAPKISV
jgi:hypothetical protein